LKNKKKLLMAAQFPEPIHGASLRNKEFYESTYVNDSFDIIKHEIQTARSITDIGGISLSKIWITILILVRGVMKAIKYKPDILYVTLSAETVGFLKDSLLILLCKPFVKMVYIHMRCYGLKSLLNSKFKKWIARCIFSNVHALVLSESLIDDAEAIIKKERIKVVGNCIDTNYFCEKKKPLLGKEINFYHISNLSEEKGSLLLLKAVSEIDLKKNNCKIHLIGSWQDKQCQNYYEALTNERSDLKDSLIYHGPLYGKEKVQIISEMDVHVFPSQYRKECFPGVILEAMYFGIPSISTKHAAIPDMVKHEETGLLIEKYDLVGLKKSIDFYCKNDKAISIHGRNAFTLYNNYFTKEIVHKVIINELYSSLEKY